MKLKNGIMDLCFVDTETSGTEPEKACILGIGAIRVELDIDNKVLRSTDLLDIKVTPTVPVDPGAAQVNGYNPKDWENADSIAVAIAKFYPLLKGAIVAGWNADFDLRFIRKAFWNLNWDWPWGTPYKSYEVSTLCTDLLYFKKLDYIHLKTVGAYYGFIPEGENPHEGLLDILLTIKIYEHYLMENKIIEKSEIDYSKLDAWVKQSKEKSRH